MAHVALILAPILFIVVEVFDVCPPILLVVSDVLHVSAPILSILVRSPDPPAAGATEGSSDLLRGADQDAGRVLSRQRHGVRMDARRWRRTLIFTPRGASRHAPHSPEWA